MQHDEVLIPIPRAALKLGVPMAWLRREVEAGRLPGILAGRRWLVHVDSVKRAILQRSEREGVHDEA